jgi:heme-degrading monooxygenase HmoA
VYMSQHQFTPVPAKYDLWVTYNRNYMTLTARAEGAILSRILRLNDDPEKFFAVGVWTDRDMAVRWSESAESRLGAKPSQDQGLYDGYPMAWTRWDLTDFAWGLEGSTAPMNPGLLVKHIAQDVPAGTMDAHLAFNRALMSLLARRPGFVAGETYRGSKGDRLLSIYTFRRPEDWRLDVDHLPADLALLVRGDLARQLWAEAPPPLVVDCTLYESVWGPAAPSLQRFITDAYSA